MTTFMNFAVISLISLSFVVGCGPTPVKKSVRTASKGTGTAAQEKDANSTKMEEFTGQDENGKDCKTPAHVFTKNVKTRELEACKFLANHVVNKYCAADERKAAFDQRGCAKLKVTWDDKVSEKSDEKAEKPAVKPTATPAASPDAKPTVNVGTLIPFLAARSNLPGPVQQPANTTTATPTPVPAQPAPAVAAAPSAAANAQSSADAAITTGMEVSGFQTYLALQSANLNLQSADFDRTHALDEKTAKAELEASLGLFNVDETVDPKIQTGLSEADQTVAQNMYAHIKECEPDLEGAACDADDEKNLFHHFMERADHAPKATVFHLTQRQSKKNKPGQAGNKQIVFLYEIKGDFEGASAKIKTEKIDSIKLFLLILKSEDKKIQSMKDFKALLDEQTASQKILTPAVEVKMKVSNYTVLLNKLLSSKDKLSVFYYKFERASNKKLLDIYDRFKSTDTGAVYKSKEEMTKNLETVLKLALEMHIKSKILAKAEDNASTYNALFARNLTTRLQQFAQDHEDIQETVIQFIATGLENSSEKIQQYSAIALRLLDPQNENESLKSNAIYSKILEQFSKKDFKPADEKVKEHFNKHKATMNLQTEAAAAAAPAKLAEAAKTTPSADDTATEVDAQPSIPTSMGGYSR